MGAVLHSCSLEACKTDQLVITDKPDMHTEKGLGRPFSGPSKPIDAWGMLTEHPLLAHDMVVLLPTIAVIMHVV